MIMIIQTGILNFFKNFDTNEHSDECECEDCDTDMGPHSTDKTNLTQANITDEKIVSPYHPLESYEFPKCTFRKSKRPCQSSWFKAYKWLHYALFDPE